VDASRPVLSRLLQDGYSVGVLPGGIREQLMPDDPEGRTVVTLRRRRGFVRLAMQYNAQLVPVLGFGERQVYRTVNALVGLRKALRRLRIGIPLVYGRWFTWMPHRVPFKVVIGKPLAVEHIEDPSDEQVDRVLEKYIAAMEELHRLHAPPGTELVIK